MSGQPFIELHQLDPTIQSAILELTSSIGAAGTVLTSTGSTLTWQAPSGALYLGNTTNPSSLSDVSVSSLLTGQILEWNGTAWVNTTPSTSSGTVTSVSATGSTGLVIAGSPITTTGNLTFTLGTELQNLSGITSDGFIQRTGGVYQGATLTSSQITTALGFTPGQGTVTSVAAVGTTGLVVSGSPITTNGTLTFTLGSELQALSQLSSTGLVARTGTATYSPITITGSSDFSITNGNGVSGNPTIALTSVATAGTYNQVTVSATGRVTAGGNVSYLTGNQTITVSGDATGSGSTSIPLTLATVNSNTGSFTNANITVNAKGLITAASSGSSSYTPFIAYLTSQSSRTSTTTTSNDATLVTGTLSPGTYRFEVNLQIGSTGTGGIQIGVNYSGSFAYGIQVAFVGQNSTNIEHQTGSLGTSPSTTNGIFFGSGATISGGGHITGTFVALTSGVFGVSWAQATSNASATNLQAGSSLQVLRLA